MRAVIRRLSDLPWQDCRKCNKRFRDEQRHERYCQPYEPPLPAFAKNERSITSELSDSRSLEAHTLCGIVAADLLELRYEHGFDEPDIRNVKSMAKRWLSDAATLQAESIKPYLANGIPVAAVEGELRRINLFDQLETQKQEMAYAAANVPYLEPRVVEVSSKHKVASFDINELIIRKLQHEPHFRKRCIEKSEEWKRGDKWRVTPSAFHDFDDGVVARFHPHLMRRAEPGEEHDLRVAILGNADDIEVAPVARRDYVLNTSLPPPLDR